MWYKVLFTLVNVVSCYWSIYKYARYFAQRYPKVAEDDKAVEVVVRMQEETENAGSANKYSVDSSNGRRFTVIALPLRGSV
jgi:hypothetical protein